MSGCNGNPNPTLPVVTPVGAKANAPLFTIEFFDWYANTVAAGTINGPNWTHKVDWAKYGISPNEVNRSAKYYDSQFQLLNNLGVDGIQYETYRNVDGSLQRPSPTMVESIKRNNTKVGSFYDLEIMSAKGKPLLSENNYITPSVALVTSFISDVNELYSYLPRQNWLIDKQGRMPIFVFGFGFETDLKYTASQWDKFYRAIISGLEAKLGRPVVIYWTARNVWPLEYAFQNFPDKVRPFNFVLDNMQPQLSSAEVTWNINFDNLGVQRRYNLLRVIRDDPRYLQEMLWLAKNSTPEIVFIYSWNEYFEGANVMPDMTYGETRYNLMQAMIKDVRENSRQSLPRTLLIIDDFSGNWSAQDWHDAAEELSVRFPYRRYIPQAKVMIARDVKPADLKDYDLIVDMQRSNAALDATLATLAATKQIVYFNPIANSTTAMTSYFANKVAYKSFNRETHILDINGKKGEAIMVRDDVMDVELNSSSRALLYIGDSSKKLPLLIQRGNDYWVNYFWPNETVFSTLFASIYGKPLEQAILFGDGVHSQRLEVAPDGKVTQQIFSAPAIYEHLPLPISFTNPPPAEIPTPNK